MAGKGKGIQHGKRSGLWSEFARLIGELRPRYIFAENVPAITTRGLDVVLCDLAALGYDAEWQCVRASDVGAPHRRERWWLVGYPNGQRESQPGGRVSDQRGRPSYTGKQLVDPNGSRLQRLGSSITQVARERATWATGETRRGRDGRIRVVKPGLRLLADGIPRRMDQLRCFGNAIVPQIPEALGRCILEWEKQQEDNDDAK